MGVPLAALAINQQQPGPLDQATKALQLKGLAQQQQYQAQAQPLELQQRQQQVQQGQLQLADQQAMTKALQSWDGKDVEELPGMVLKHGGSAQAVFGLKNQIVEQRKNLASADEATLKNQSTRNDLLAGHIESIKAAPDKQAAYQKMVDEVTQQGLAKPGQLPQQYPGDDQLDLFEKSLIGQKQLTQQAMEERKVKAQESEAATKGQAAQTSAAKFQAELPGGPLNKVAQDIAIATNPQIQQGKIRVAAAEGAARAEVAERIARGSNAALAEVPQHLIAPATADATKAGNDYAQAKSVSDRLGAVMDAARRGNVVSYQLLPQEGALQLTTSQGVHRINMAEIQNYGGGSLWQKMQGHIGKALTGKSIPESVLNDMAEMQKFMAEGSQSKYENSLKTINQNYGSKFKPVEMETMKEAPQAAPQHTPGGQAQGLKEGQTGSGSDGKKYVVKGGVWQLVQ